MKLILQMFFIILKSGDTFWFLWCFFSAGVFLLNMTLCLPDSQLFPSEVVKARLTIVNQLSEKLSISKGDSIYCVHLLIHFWWMIVCKSFYPSHCQLQYHTPSQTRTLLLVIIVLC